MQATTNARPASHGWLLSPAADLMLFIGLPALILASLCGLSKVLPLTQIYVAVFGAMSLGHHLPGFLKAYGDENVFKAHKKTLIASPLLLFPAMLVCVYQDLQGIIALRAAWSLWHGGMQAYGILRNYDAKKGGLSRLNAAMDRIFAGLLFTSYLVFFRQDNCYEILSQLYSSGVPLVSKGAFAVAGTVVTTSLYVFCGLYACYHLWLWRTQRAFNPVKVLYAGTMAAFVIGAFSTHLVVGLLALLAGELYHDVQYNALAYSALKKKGFFAGSFRKAALYVLLIAAYGSLHFLNDVIPGDRLTDVYNVFAAVVLTSSFLHYYFDGFIWKRPTQNVKVSPKVWQAAVAVLAFAVFVYGHRPEAPGTGLATAGAFAELLPQSEEANVVFAKELEKRGELAAAGYVYKKTIDVDPTSAQGHLGLGRVLAATTDGRAQAVEHLERAVSLDPRLTRRTVRLARRLSVDLHGN